MLEKILFQRHLLIARIQWGLLRTTDRSGLCMITICSWYCNTYLWLFFRSDIFNMGLLEPAGVHPVADLH